MQATVTMRDLKHALATLRPIISRKDVGVTGRHARIEAVGEKVLVAASNLDVEISVAIPGDVVLPGRVAVPFRPLDKLVHTTKGTMELTREGDDQVRAVNGITSTLQAAPIDEQPAGYQWPSGDTTVIPVDTAALRDVLCAAHSDSYRPVLCSVYFHGHEIVTTDSFRLHRARSRFEYPDMLIPAAPLVPVAKAKDPAVMFVHPDATHVRIEQGSVTRTVRLTEGTYPEYERLFGPQGLHAVRFDRATIVDAVKQVKVLADAYGVVRLKVTGPHAVMVWTLQNGVGVAGVTVAADYSGNHVFADDPDMDGDPLIVAYNPVFLLDGLTVGAGDAVTLRFLDGIKPAFITDASTTDRLLMPVKLQ